MPGSEMSDAAPTPPTLPSSPASPAKRSAGKGRAIAARAVTIVAILLALIGGIAFYLERSVLDEGGFETIATELILSDEIREQVAGTAVEQLYANVDVEQAIAERLPENQKALAPVLAGIARQGAAEAANRLLERPRLQEAWVRVATATQRQLVELLDDEGEFVSTTGGEVVLDLRPIIIDLGDQVAIIGRVAEQLPESTGKIAIVSSDQLETAQTAARILRALANWLWLVALLLAALAIWLARGRRRIELRAVAVGLVVVGVLMLFVRRYAGAYLVDSLTTDATEPAGSDAWRILTQGLSDRAWIAIVLGAPHARGRLARRPDTAGRARQDARRSRCRPPALDVRCRRRSRRRPGGSRPAVPARPPLRPRLRRAPRRRCRGAPSRDRARDRRTRLTPAASRRATIDAMLLDEIARTSAAVSETSARSAKVAALAACLGAARPDEAPIAVAYLSGTLPHGPIGVGWAALRDLPAAAAGPPTLELARGRRRPPGASERRAGRARRSHVVARSRSSSPVRPSPSSGSSAPCCTASSGRVRSRASSPTRWRAPPASPSPTCAARSCSRATSAWSRLRPSCDGDAGLARFRLEVLRPLKPMLAQTADSAGEALARVGAAAVEWKLDGARLQVHRRGGDVRAFTRNLADITDRVPEVVEAVLALPVEAVVLDGEAIALRSDGHPEPFQVTMSRFGSKTLGQRVERSPRSSSTASTSTARTSSTSRSRSGARRSSVASRSRCARRPSRRATPRRQSASSSVRSRTGTRV